MSDNQLIISVNLVQEDDYPQWLPYWLSYQKFYQVQLPEETTLAAWKRFFDADIPMYCAVAKEGQKILGFVHYVFHGSTWAVNDFCYLEDLFVAPEARGKHIGKRLIEYVKQQAQARQCARLYWHTQESNLTAHRLYDWVGEKPGVIEYRMPL
ncbi:ribosomal-protein-alanine acetyltransferase [Pragia fontium]|uniref:N-acetyltransferase n=1 Tax=Pragia fontium TaxID=82985 RepID=A0ABQ5LN53_9GAMM|nr:GNAT family N-acetyltransferase [Pragia fontium]GKX64332.1 N-acetyltransferase [Pragia fontium]SUB80988.1 ribosomal-protein-alanine acetyltransferase [Pragia fontium]